MNTSNTTNNSVTWTDQNITDLVRTLRNDLIKDFLDERNLIEYFSKQYNRKEISTIIVQFIKKELKELLITPVDLKHYAPVIEQIRESGSASISEKYEQLFYKDVERIFKIYL